MLQKISTAGPGLRVHAQTLREEIQAGTAAAGQQCSEGTETTAGTAKNTGAWIVGTGGASVGQALDAGLAQGSGFAATVAAAVHQTLVSAAESTWVIARELFFYKVC